MTGKDLKEKIQKFDYKGACNKVVVKVKELKIMEKLKGFPINYYLYACGVLLLLVLILMGQGSGKSKKLKALQNELVAAQTQAQNDASASAA